MDPLSNTEGDDLFNVNFNEEVGIFDDKPKPKPKSPTPPMNAQSMPVYSNKKQPCTRNNQTTPTSNSYKQEKPLPQSRNHSRRNHRQTNYNNNSNNNSTTSYGNIQDNSNSNNTSGSIMLTAHQPTLLMSIPGHANVVTSIFYVEEEQVFITTSLDCTVRVWSKNNDSFWPCAWETIHCCPSSAVYHKSKNQLYLGLDNGSILVFGISSAFDKFQYVGSYMGHNSKVNTLYLDEDEGMLISGGKDKFVNVYDIKQRNENPGHGSQAYFISPSGISCLVWDKNTKHIFCGTVTGEIILLKYTPKGLKLIKILTAHAGEVTCLAWDSSRQILFSGGEDGRIVMWDFGTKKGTTYELNKHLKTVRTIIYLKTTNELLSYGDDGCLTTWNLEADRIMTPTWEESDICQICREPFFWAYKIKFNTNRQHHCRKCGRALCRRCVPYQAKYCIAGYENKELMCKECFPKLTNEETTPAAKSIMLYDMAFLTWIPKTNRLLAAAKDNSFRMYAIPDI